MFLVQNVFLDGIFVCAKLVFFGWNFQKIHAQDICKRGVCITTHNHTTFAQLIVEPWPPPPIVHSNANMDNIKFSLYPLDFIFKLLKATFLHNNHQTRPFS
jgi:hypothetical protein